MDQQGRKVTFRGDRIQFLKETYVYSLPILLCFSVLLMGSFWLNPFVIFLVLLFPFPFFLSLNDRFTLDDEKKKITKILTRGMPYEKIRALYVSETGGTLAVNARTGRLRKISLAAALPVSEKQLLLDELAKRFPEEIIHLKQRSTIKRIIAMLFLSSLVLSLGHLYMYWKFPKPFTMPEIRYLATTQNPSDGGEKQNLGGFSFSVLQDLKPVDAKDKELMFEDEGKKTRVRVSGSLFKKVFVDRKGIYEIAFRYTMGMKDMYDFYRVTFSSRFGFVPLLARIAALSDQSDTGVYAVLHPVLKGFVVQGIRRGRETTHIVLVDKKTGGEINFFISSSGKIEEETLKSFIGTVRVL